jgi:hypothetical protein
MGWFTGDCEVKALPDNISCWAGADDRTGFLLGGFAPMPDSLAPIQSETTYDLGKSAVKSIGSFFIAQEAQECS